MSFFPTFRFRGAAARAASPHFAIRFAFRQAARCGALLLGALALHPAARAQASGSALVWSTFAGGGASTGQIDGIGKQASMAAGGAVFAPNGDLIVAEMESCVIRRISPARVVTTIAGVWRQRGSTNGPVSVARFDYPVAVALDGAGNIYVSESLGNSIRKITPAGEVSTFAGLAGAAGGYSDGTGSAARFNGLGGLVFDQEGNLIVSDRGNYVLRKITPAGVVTTLAGGVLQWGTADGPGATARFAGAMGLARNAAGEILVADYGAIRKVAADGTVTTLAGNALDTRTVNGPLATARFHAPFAIAVDPAGYLYIADWSDDTIRRITPGGIVETIGGNPDWFGYVDGPSAGTRFSSPRGLALDSRGELYVSDGNGCIRTTTLPVFTEHPASQTGILDDAVTFSVATRLTSPTYQWNFNGAAIAGANQATYIVPVVAGSHAGTYTATVSAGGFSYTSDPATLSISTSVYPTPYSFTTVAGRAGMLGSMGGTAAKFNAPFGIARDAGGNLFVADSDNHTIRKITPAGIVSTFAGKAGESGAADGTGAEARLRYPRYVAFDASGNLYVSEYSHRIRKITTAGAVTTFAGAYDTPGTADGAAASARFKAPSGLAFDSQGNLFVADSGNSTIRRITPAGEVSTWAGVAGQTGNMGTERTTARFTSPAGLVIDASDNVYVADQSLKSIRKITPAGVVSFHAGNAMTFDVQAGNQDGVGTAASFGIPTSLAIDRTGNVYVSDQIYANIRKIAPDRTVTTFSKSKVNNGGFADGAASWVQYGNPLGIAMAPDGVMYVTDFQWNAVRKVDLDGSVSTIAGQAGFAGDADSDGPAILLGNPTSIAVDDDENIYVTETAGSFVRKLTPPATSVVLAGQINQTLGSDQRYAYYALQSPLGITVDAARNVYYNNWGDSSIEKVSPAGVRSLVTGIPSHSAFRDGTRDVAMLYHPQSLVVDPSGNLFVADTDNSVIRRVSPEGTVSTLAGVAWRVGTTFGTGPSVWFGWLTGIARDSAGKLFVADSSNQQIRTVTLAGEVAHYAGVYQAPGSADGTWTAARFNEPNSVAVDSVGNVFVADSKNHAIRLISPDGFVTTIGGLAGTKGSSDGVGQRARFSRPMSVAIGRNGAIYVADTDNATIRRGVPTVPTFLSQPSNRISAPGRSAVFSISVTTWVAASFQWQVSTNNGASWTNVSDGATYSGASTSSLTVKQALDGMNGWLFRAVASSATGSNRSNGAKLTIDASATSHVVALSARALVGTGSNVLIPGFNIAGSGTKRLLIRAVGPTLEGFGVPGVLANPKLELRKLSGPVLTANDDWGTSDPTLADIARQVGAFELPAGSKDAALVASLDAGLYTAEISGVGGGQGVALLEVYDLDPYSGSLTGIATRAVVGTGSNVLIPGIVVDGVASKRLLVRVSGPQLRAYGLTGELVDPKLEIRPLGGNVITSNDNWDPTNTELTTVTAQIGLTPFVSGSKDAGTVVTLPPGVYTIMVSGADGGGGVALVELYDVP